VAIEMKRWNLFLPPELLADVKRLARRQKQPASWVVRTACEKYLAAVKKADTAALLKAPERVSESA
jgi:predicted transcriptional regulator